MILAYVCVISAGKLFQADVPKPLVGNWAEPSGNSFAVFQEGTFQIVNCEYDFESSGRRVRKVLKRATGHVTEVARDQLRFDADGTSFLGKYQAKENGLVLTLDGKGPQYLRREGKEALLGPTLVFEFKAQAAISNQARRQAEVALRDRIRACLGAPYERIGEVTNFILTVPDCHDVSLVKALAQTKGVYALKEARDVCTPKSPYRMFTVEPSKSSAWVPQIGLRARSTARDLDGKGLQQVANAWPSLCTGMSSDVAYDSDSQRVSWRLPETVAKTAMAKMRQLNGTALLALCLDGNPIAILPDTETTWTGSVLLLKLGLDNRQAFFMNVLNRSGPLNVILNLTKLTTGFQKL